MIYSNVSPAGGQLAVVASNNIIVYNNQGLNSRLLIMDRSDPQAAITHPYARPLTG